MLDFDAILANTFVASAEYHEMLDSTNNRARQCALEGVPLPRLIVTNRQTAGRGRGSNRWWTGPGSLAMSVLLPANRIPKDPRQSVYVSLAVGVAVIDTLRGQAADALFQELGLHWPNDVMLAGRKLAGILIEALPDRSHIVGIGINTNNTVLDAPAELRDRLTTLRDATGRLWDHGEILFELMRRLEIELDRLNDDPARLVERVNELCGPYGGVAAVEHTGKE
ncbi:MAG TPA: biotin--[acetyl-CoA-carboxylase] ligase [Planctomycetaceae bacterium]|nr:biotin--[acetyl-CoA-carboxylase] ligase [Planctomycetaceae bacterium]